MTHFEILISILTGVYVLLTGYYAWTSHRTLKAIQNQNVEVKKSADAAKDNADALINSERPWVVPKIRKDVKWIDSIGTDETDESTYGKPVKKRVVYFTFLITNLGRTPAEVFAIRGRPTLTKHGINGGLEDPPDYGEELVFMQVRMLAPGEEWIYDDIDLEYRWADKKTWKDIENFSLHIIFKGVVLYRDTLRREVVHESRFCYTYFFLREAYLPSGPPDHTKYT